MVQYVTLDELSDISAEFAKEERQTIIKSAHERSPSGSTFLSHSSKDGSKYISSVVRILENHGGKVYIDKKDESLPPHTSQETASILRNRIKQCSKFILFATKNSKDSRWVPWELGLADGYKKAKNTAIFPGVDSAIDVQWSEQEYLGLYDRIVWGRLEGYSDSLWMVWNHEKNSAMPLRQWLQDE